MPGNQIVLIDLKGEIYADKWKTKFEFTPWEVICDMWKVHGKERVTLFDQLVWMI